MEIQVSKLREALDMLKPAVDTKSTLPVIKSAWLGDGKAIATDLTTAVRVNLPDIAGQEPLLLPLKEALEFLKRSPGHRTVVITTAEKLVMVSVDGAQASFESGYAADYPPVPPVEGEGQGVLDGDAWLRAMQAVAPYVATEDARPVLKTICLTPGDTIEVAGADGFRMAWETVPGRLASQKQMLIPTETVEVLAHLWKRAARPDMSSVSDPASLARAKRLMRLNWTDARLQVSFGEVAVIAQLVQGTFPSYRQLIPSNGTATVTVMAEDLERALRQLALAARDGSGIVRMTWAGEQLTLMAKSEKCQTSVPLPATCSGPGRIAVSIKYLLEYCKGKTGKVAMSWSSSSSPLLFSHRDHPHVVMMPMFVKSDDEQKAPADKSVEEHKAETPEDTVEEVEVESGGTDIAVEADEAGAVATSREDIEPATVEKAEPAAKKSKRQRKKAESPAG